MAVTDPGTVRGISMSSIRNNQEPPLERASRKLATALSSEPKCNSPVGLGAKRPTVGGRADVTRARWQGGVCLHTPPVYHVANSLGGRFDGGQP